MALLRTSMPRVCTETVCAPPPRTAPRLHWCGPEVPCLGLCHFPAGPRDIRHKHTCEACKLHLVARRLKTCTLLVSRTLALASRRRPSKGEKGAKLGQEVWFRTRHTRWLCCTRADSHTGPGVISSTSCTPTPRTCSTTAFTFSLNSPIGTCCRALRKTQVCEYRRLCVAGAAQLNSRAVSWCS